MKKKMMKAIKALNAYIDNDRQKLCDELHEVKLSHKRMERLLNRVFIYMSTLIVACDNGDFDSLYAGIKKELSYPYLRRNWGYTHKQELGYYCDN